MKLIILSSVLLLTGCASQCKSHCILGFGPGSSAFEAVANHYDSRDPCQYKGKPEGYKLADFCGANRNKQTYTVKDVSGKTVYRIQ